MRSTLVALLVAGCATTATTDDFSGDGKDDGYDASAARKRETAVATKFDAADAATLRQLVAMLPKGAYLHMHLSGAATTESLVQIGAADSDCVSSSYVAQACSIGGAPIGTATGSSQWRQIIDAWSMEDNTQASVDDRHAHFFAAFGKFGFISRTHTADMLADVRRTAAAENISYLEVMISLGQSTGGKLAEQLMPAGGPWNATAFAAARKQILADPSIASTIARTRSDLDSWEQRQNAELGCGGSHAEPACDVTVRYLVQGTRIATRESVFGQFVYGFALAGEDSRVVGVNLVQAEDDPESLRNYHDQMVGIGWIVDDAAQRGTPVPISLHAGELTSAFASASDLAFHVREAVEIAGASRIGHATDILGESGAASLIQTMAQNRIAVEACLTSNQQLLDVEGSAHPVASLFHSGVPIAFSTDDQGILRVDMNDEIVRAFETQQLSYHVIKRAIRASMAATFLPGARIADLTACHKSLYDEKLYAACETALASSEHATAEWQLETALDAFETALLN